VFSNRKWQQFALFLNLVGTALLFYSFQATSSDFRLVSAIQHSVIAGDLHEYALCVNNYTLVVTNGQNGVGFGVRGCPDWNNSRSVAVVNIEHPTFEGLGFAILLSGFFLQYLAVPQPRTIAQMRKELKLLKEQEKQNRRST
jgi:hypothetical protein